mmetsp:Transcript_40494/g.109448  ORF Transcript_40494/g.109448 Transcript_40494/m.109448 type:complete len:336 (+) Transcript_40494:101-1108(+)
MHWHCAWTSHPYRMAAAARARKASREAAGSSERALLRRLRQRAEVAQHRMDGKGDVHGCRALQGQGHGSSAPELRASCCGFGSGQDNQLHELILRAPAEEPLHCLVAVLEAPLEALARGAISGDEAHAKEVDAYPVLGFGRLLVDLDHLLRRILNGDALLGHAHLLAAHPIVNAKELHALQQREDAAHLHESRLVLVVVPYRVEALDNLRGPLAAVALVAEADLGHELLEDALLGEGAFFDERAEVVVLENHEVHGNLDHEGNILWDGIVQEVPDGLSEGQRGVHEVAGKQALGDLQESPLVEKPGGSAAGGLQGRPLLEERRHAHASREQAVHL